MKNQFQLPRRLSRLAVTLLCAYSARAVELENPQVTFEAVGKPSFIKIKGEGKKLSHTVTPNKTASAEVFEFDLRDLSTGIDMRDEHMKDKYLNVKQHPIATLKIPATADSVMNFKGEKETKGTLTLNGKDKEVTVKSKKEGDAIASDFEVKLSDYGIEIPSWSGITVADTVKISTRFKPVLKTPELAR